MVSIHTLVGVALLAGLLGAIGGFLVGWIAHGEQLRIYRDSRRRHTEHLTQLVEQLAQHDRVQRREEAPARWDAQRVPTYVPVPVPVPVAFPVAVPVAGSGLGWSQPVLDTHRTQITDGAPVLPQTPGQAR